MAEANTNNKIGILAKAQKQLSRTKTKVLQNLGKAEKTTDDVFKDHVLKTERQQEVAQHLQKELKTYSHCVKDLSLACKNLQHALAETYEPEWKGESKFKSQLQAFELLWNDYLQKLQDNVINPMNAYLQSFPVLKAKVSKRGRKMVDYDNSRHNLEVLQAAKKRDDAKIAKAQDELKDVKRIFDELNNELHTELPDFYDSRVTFYADLYSKFFDAEYTLHTEVGKTCDSIQDIAQSLGKDFEHYKYKPKRPTSVTDGSVSSVNGETPITASPSLRSSTSSSHSPQKEPMYSNQDQANMPQSVVKPKRKAPVAPTLGPPYYPLQAEISCSSLDTVCSQPSNASISSGSHHSFKAEILKCKKYFGRWRRQFQSKRSTKDLESNIEAKGEAALEVSLTDLKPSPAGSKVEGAKSLCDERTTPKKSKNGEKMKAMSLPDHLKEDPNSKPISALQDVPAASGLVEASAKALNEANCAAVHEEVKMKPVVHHISFCIPEAVDDVAKSQQRVSGDIEKVSLASTESSGTGTSSKTSESDSDDDSYVKSMIENIKAADDKISSSDIASAAARLQSKLFSPSPASSTNKDVANVDQDEALLDEVVKPNHFVPLDEIAKKHLAMKKCHFKSNRQSSIKEMEPEMESKVTVLDPVTQACPVNLQLLPDVKRDESSIKWNQTKNSWVDREIYGSNKAEVCPLLSDEDDDQFTSCRDDFQSNASAPKLDIFNSVDGMETIERKTTVKKHSKGKKAATGKKEFYKVAFLESSSSAEDEYETIREALPPVKIVEEPKLENEDNKLFNKEKLNFLSQHLLKKHVLQADKGPESSLETKDSVLIPSTDLTAGNINKITVNETCECLGDVCVKNDCLEDEEDDEKTAVDGGSDSESFTAVSHREARSASVDLPMKKSKSLAKKLPLNAKVAMSDQPPKISSQAMPEAWQDDNMKDSYDIVTVYTEDLSATPQLELESTMKQQGQTAKITTDIVTEIPASEAHSKGETTLGSAALTVNVCLNNDTSPLLVRPWLDKGKDIHSGASSDSDTSTFTNQPKFRAPKSQDKLTESGCEEVKNKLNRAVSLEERSLGTRKPPENVYYAKNDKGAKEDIDFGSLSNSSVSIVTANETFLKDDSDPSVSMASNRWNLRGLMSMLMPVTVQTLASHTKSYINSYLSSNKPSEKDAIEIQKIIAENLSKEDYYNLIGKSRDSSVDISINLDEINGMPDDTLKTAQEDLLSLSTVAKLGDATDQMSFSVDKPQNDPDITPQISEHSFQDVTLTKTVPEAGALGVEQQKVDSNDLDILEQHFQTVLLDIVSKGSTQLKKNKIAAAKNPKSASTPMSSEHLENEQIRGISSHGSGLNSEGTDKENSYLLHDAMLSRLQMSLPLLSKSQGKAEPGVISDDSSMDNACSWTFSRESLISKSSADNDLDQGQPEDAKGTTGHGKKKSKVQSPPLESTLHKSLATRRDALKCSGEDDECLVNEDSDQCTHASDASLDSTHSTIFLGLCSNSVGESYKGKDQCTESAYASHKVMSPHALSTISQSLLGAAEINYDSNMSMAEEPLQSNLRMSSHEALVVIEDKDMMDFKNLFSQSEYFCDAHPPAHKVIRAEVYAKSAGHYDAQNFVTPDLKHETYKACCSTEEKFVDNESQQDCDIGDTNRIHCLFGDDTPCVEDEELKDFGSGDDKDSEDFFNGWGHDEDICECPEAIPEEEMWMEHTVGQQQCPELPLGTLELQPGWKDLRRVDLDEEHVESLVDTHYKKQDFCTDAGSNSAVQIDGSGAPEIQGLDKRPKKDRKVRFSSFVEVCSETELDEVMMDDGVASLTVYRDALKDCDDDDVRSIDDDVTDAILRLDQLSDDDAWYSPDNDTAVQEEKSDNRGMYDLIHSEQFVNSQYARDETSFYRQRSVMHSRDKKKARRAQFFYSDNAAEMANECETYNLPAWPLIEDTDQLDELDILVHIQPVSLMPRELKHGMSLLDEELLAIKEDLEYSLQKNPAPGLSLILNKYGCLLSFDKPVSESFVEGFEDQTGFGKVEILNAYNRSHSGIMNTNEELVASLEDDRMNVLCEADAQANLNSSSLDLGDYKSLREESATSQCGDGGNVSQAQESSNEEIRDSQEIVLTQCQKLFSCNCKNVICLGCCPHSNDYVKEVESIYVPEKFTMSLEDALRRYQDTYHVHFSTIIKQNDYLEYKDITHESEMLDGSAKAETLPKAENEKLCEISVEPETDVGLRSAIIGMGMESLETSVAPVEDHNFEDFINKCPSTELSLLIPQTTETENNLLLKEADELKLDETELGFLQRIDTRLEDQDKSITSALGECCKWENCLSFPLMDKGPHDCNELAEDSSRDGAPTELQGMYEGYDRNNETCSFLQEHCEHDQSQLLRRDLTVAETESVDVVSAKSEEFFSVLSHPASLSLKHVASFENVCQNLSQVVDQDLSQSSKSASFAENYKLFMPANVDLSSEECTEMPSELAALCTFLDPPTAELSSGCEDTSVFPPACHMLYRQMLEDHQDDTEKIVCEFSSVGSSCLSHSVDDVTMDSFDDDTSYFG